MNSSVGDPRWQMIFAFEHETALFVSLVASIANLYNALLPQGYTCWQVGQSQREQT
jgi:hypothetical protein